ncbi:MAG: hypothetical protein ACJ71I_01190 [Nitrososphaeraceae archaeon]
MSSNSLTRKLTASSLSIPVLFSVPFHVVYSANWLFWLENTISSILALAKEEGVANSPI